MVVIQRSVIKTLMKNSIGHTDMANMDEFKTPRFVLTSIFTFTTSVAYFILDKMDGDQYLYAMGTILGAYTMTAITRTLGTKKNAENDI